MSQPLQKAPLGLLQLFRLRSGGVGPEQFGGELTPTVECVDFYGVDRVVGVLETSAAGTASTMASASSQFARRLLGLSGTFTVGAAGGTWLHLSINVQIAPSTARIGFGVVHITTPIPTAIYRVAASLPMPLVLPPGHSYVLEVNSDAGGADHVKSLRYLYQRLDSD